MFHIIGVAHRVQSKRKGAEDSEDQEKFRHCLVEIVRRVKPVLIAEEFSADVLEMLTKDCGAEYESVTKAVADGLHVMHRFCDPTAKARTEMGYREGTDIACCIAIHDTENLSNAEVNDRGFAIEVVAYWPLRERFWLAQLDDVKNRDVVFVCGDAHMDGFRALLEENNIGSVPAARRIGLTPSDDEWWNRVKKYIGVHPELRDWPKDSST